MAPRRTAEDRHGAPRTSETVCGSDRPFHVFHWIKHQGLGAFWESRRQIDGRRPDSAPRPANCAETGRFPKKLVLLREFSAQPKFDAQYLGVDTVRLGTSS